MRKMTQIKLMISTRKKKRKRRKKGLRHKSYTYLLPCLPLCQNIKYHSVLICQSEIFQEKSEHSESDKRVVRALREHSGTHALMFETPLTKAPGIKLMGTLNTSGNSPEYGHLEVSGKVQESRLALIFYFT